MKIGTLDQFCEFCQSQRYDGSGVINGELRPVAIVVQGINRADGPDDLIDLKGEVITLAALDRNAAGDHLFGVLIRYPGRPFPCHAVLSDDSIVVW